MDTKRDPAAVDERSIVGTMRCMECDVVFELRDGDDPRDFGDRLDEHLVQVHRPV